MKKLILLFAIGLITSSSFAQAENNQYDMHLRMIDLDDKARSFGLTQAQYEAVINQAYVNENFLHSYIYLNEKPMGSSVFARYNASADEIEIKKTQNAEEYSALAKDPNISIKIGNETYVLVPLRGSNADGGYFNVLYKGENYDLYKKVTANFREPRDARTSYEPAVPPAFTKVTTYYMVENGSFYEMPTGKSKILSVFNKKKNEIRSFVKQNKLDVRKEADLAKVVAYFDELNK